jgi:hydrogenase maturation protease
MNRARDAGDRQSDVVETADLHDAMLIGIGNDGRSDDGLGWAFLQAIELDDQFCGPIVYRYQLQIEDAELISHARRVVFIDACHHPLPNGYQWQTCERAYDVEYTSHQLSPQTVLFLCQQLYDKTPAANLLLIEGCSWDLQLGLSAAAKIHLEEALRFFQAPT